MRCQTFQSAVPALVHPLPFPDKDNVEMTVRTSTCHYVICKRSHVMNGANPGGVHLLRSHFSTVRICCLPQLTELRDSKALIERKWAKFSSQASELHFQQLPPWAQNRLHSLWKWKSTPGACKLTRASKFSCRYDWCSLMSCSEINCTQNPP